MIERDFISQKTKEYYIRRYVEEKLPRVGISSIRLKKIPLGEKIVIETARPSLVVGSKGSNIKELTRVLKKRFKLENPQIEINEVKNIYLDAQIVADRIAGSLERFGPARFKGVGHKTLENVMRAGALGVEVIISGKLPSARARRWRFYQGYLKKCGDVAVSDVKSAQTTARVKSGIIGIQVSIMPPNVILPDHVEILPEIEQVTEVVEEPAQAEEKKQTKPRKKATKKKASSKKVAEKKDAKEDAKTQAPAQEAQAKEEAPAEASESVSESAQAELSEETKEEAPVKREENADE